MIGHLRGTLLLVEGEVAIVEVGGVGYEVWPTLDALGGAVAGAEVRMVIHTLVREDEIRLFGFASLRERALFEELMRVSGVGPRTSLLLLSQLGAAGLESAVLSANPLPLVRIKGVGKRTAERILLELPERVAKLEVGSGPAPGRVSSGGPQAALQEVQEALTGLGYKRQQIAGVLTSLKELEGELAVDELIREALKRLRK